MAVVFERFFRNFITQTGDNQESFVILSLPLYFNWAKDERGERGGSLGGVSFRSTNFKLLYHSELLEFGKYSTFQPPSKD